MNLGEISVRIVGDMEPLRSDLSGALPEAVRMGERAGNSYGQGFGGGLRNALHSVDEAAYMVRNIFRGIGAASGIGIAAETEDIIAQLESVTGSAEKAQRAMEEFSAIGLRSAFNTSEVARFGAALLNTGDDVESVTEQLNKLIDAASFANVSNAGMPRFMENLVQMRTMPKAERIDIKQMMRQAPGMGRIIAAGLGMKGTVSTEHAAQMAKTMSGQEFYDAILKGSDALAKGAAEARALRSPLAFVANLFESIGRIMLPTGRILLALLLPIGRWVKSMSDALGWINKVTGGVAGLVAIFGLLYAGRQLVAAAFLGAITYTRELTARLFEYAAAARMAAGATLGSSVAGAAGAGTAGAAAAGAAGVGFLAKMKGFGAKALGFGKSMLKGGGPAAFGSIGLELAGQATEKSNPGASKYLKNMGAYGGVGALTGGIIGSIFPVIGTAIGSAVGFAVGAIGGAIKTAVENSSPKSAGDPQTKLLKEIADNTKESAKRVGMGPRQIAGESRVEAEFRWSQMFIQSYGVG